MKKLLLAFALAPIIAYADKNPPTEPPAPFQFTLIDSVTASKNEIFVRASEWLAKTYGSSQDVIQMNDKEAGKIIGKAVMHVKWTPVFMQIEENVHYTLAIDVKEGKYRIVLSDFVDHGSFKTPEQGALDNEEPNSRFNMPVSKWKGLKRTAADQSQNILESFKNAIRTQSNSDF